MVPLGSLRQLCRLHGSEACSWEGQNSDFEESCIVLTHFRVPNEADLVRMSEEGKPTGRPTGPRARRLFSYIGVLARGWAAYVGYVAPQSVAMWAI